MIPVYGNTDIKFETQPSLNYEMHLEDESIYDKCDKLDAMKQVIYKILNTERYRYYIYSWNYGVELEELFGKPVYYVVPELERRITEALTADERIEKVTDFEFDTSERKTVHCKFKVHTIFGEVDIEKVVKF